MSNSSRSDDGNPSKGGDDREVLLSMYDQHRQEIRAHGKRKSRRYLGSLTVLGVIVGYVFTTNGDGRVLVLVPYVLGFLYLSHISSMHYVTQLAALLALIEAKLDHLGAEYELFHGGFSIRQNPRFQNLEAKYLNEFKHAKKDSDLQGLHRIIQLCVRYSMRGIALTAYIVPMAAGTWAVYREGAPDDWTGLLSMFPGPSWIGPALIPGTQIVLLVVIGAAWWQYRNHKDLLKSGVLESVLEDDLESKIGEIEDLDMYSVWLVPDRGSEAYQQLEETIEEYAQLDEDAPEFEPHITVVGGIQDSESVLEEGVQSLAEGQAVFDIEFTGVQCSTTRHQCVFLLVEPTAEVLSLHQEAVEVFDVDDGMYVPHLSLIYSDMDVEERLDLAESIDMSTFPSTVQVGELVLVKTTGPVSEWETVARYNL